MKIQDAGFLIILLVLMFLRKEKWFVYAGLISLFIAIPLFYRWIFFTADRLIWYSVSFLFIGTVMLILQESRTA